MCQHETRQSTTGYLNASRIVCVPGVAAALFIWVRHLATLVPAYSSLACHDAATWDGSRNGRHQEWCCIIRMNMYYAFI